MKKTLAIACAAALCMTMTFAQTAGTTDTAAADTTATADAAAADTTTATAAADTAAADTATVTTDTTAATAAGTTTTAATETVTADTSAASAAGTKEAAPAEMTAKEKKAAAKAAAAAAAAQKKADEAAAKQAAKEAAAQKKADAAAAKKTAKAPAAAKTYKVPVESIALDQTDMELAVHILDYQTAIPSLSVKFTPSNPTCTDIKWTSSDMSIVKVDQIGRLFPAKVGTAVITATSKDGGFTASCNVEITKFGPKPKADVKVTTDLTGDASVTFGTDLDTGKSGFATDQNIKLKINLLNLGEVWADNPDALPIWGEIRVYTQGDPFKYTVDDDSGKNLALNDSGDTNDGAFKIYVDRAKIHVGNAFINLYDRHYTNLGFVNYTSHPDVAYEFVGIDTTRRYGQLKTKTLQTYLSSTDDSDTVYGLQAGYQMDNVFKVAGDFASTMKWVAGSSDTTKDTADPSQKATDWVYKVTGSLLFVPNLVIEGGYSNGILGKDSVYKQDMRFGGQISYQWNFYDIFYLKPKAGITMVQIEGRGSAYPLVSGGFLLGWEDKQSAFDTWFSGTRPRYLEDDYGAYPGLAMAVEYADKKLARDCVVNDGRYDSSENDIVVVHGSFNTGNGLLIKNFEAVGAVDVIDALSDKMIIGATTGVKYWMPMSKYFSITPKAFLTRYYDKYNNDNDYMYLKGGLEFAYERVSLSFDYESNDILVGFNDGTAYRKAGKLETTLKVKF